ncbi:hypothetical protein [Staphylococcus sp. CH99b_3]|uniref:hypothetical protein n=1 Tax=Staphylococcus sp. CH99b_3 TaxID=2651838 RepID=UPI00124ED210|nr:hypothetical protein [Staphylococcus sp. CH99b_3]KAB2479787.1 hypothetical protein F9B39_02780 [Staphylococcus sp. CH99b_3]
MILTILGYVLSIGFVVFGIYAFVLWELLLFGNEQQSKKSSNTKCISMSIVTAICSVALIIMANVV